MITASSGVKSSQWEIVANTLTLRTAAHRIHFAPKYIKELPDSSVTVEPVSIDRLRTRAARAGVNIGEIKLSNGDSTIAYGSEERSDVSQDETLTAIARAVRNATVVSAVARVGDSSKSVRCNLRDATASGNSNSMYHLSDLAEYAVPLLDDLSFEELQELRAKTSSPVEDPPNEPVTAVAPTEPEPHDR